MKKSLLLAWIILANCSMAAVPLMRLADGSVIFEVEFSKVTHRGLIFMHRDGFATLRPEQLNEDDQRTFAAQIKSFRAKEKAERARLAKVRRDRQIAARRAAADRRNRQRALQTGFDQRIAAIREKGTEHFYIEGTRLLNLYRGKRVNSKALRAMIKEGWEQKSTAPVITDKNQLAYALFLDKFILRYRYILGANNMKTELKKEYAELLREYNRVLGKLTVDELLLVMWQNENNRKYFTLAIKFLERSDQTKAAAKELQTMDRQELEARNARLRRIFVNPNQLKQMRPEGDEIAEVTGALQFKMLCPQCKGRGIVGFRKEKRTETVEVEVPAGEAPAPAPAAEGDAASGDEAAAAPAAPAAPAKRQEKREIEVEVPYIQLEYSEGIGKEAPKLCSKCTFGLIVPAPEN